MATEFIATRGCVYTVERAGGGQGFYSLSPDLNGSESAPVLIESVDATLQDVVFPVSTLDKKKYLYVMGDDFGNVGVSGAVLLGESGNGGGGFNTVIDYFKANRASAKETPITISGPGGVSLKCHLTAFVLSRADPEFNIQFFQFRGLIVEPKQA